MLELDECRQLLVTNPFADDNAVASSTSKHDSLVTVRSDNHPLHARSRSRPPERIPSTVAVMDNEGETRPGLTRVLNPDGYPAEDLADQMASEAPQRSKDVIIHSVGPNDSFASVAVRYGVSIAALRRANHLWPSDPIHLRTELVIPRGDSFPLRYRRSRNASTDTLLGSTIESPHGLGLNLVTSPFVSARNMILSVLPARISLDSLNSKTSTSEDHEMDDFRLRALSADDPPPAEAGFALSLLTTPFTYHKGPSISLPSRVPSSATTTQRLDLNHVPPVNSVRPWSTFPSRTWSLERLPRLQPFATSAVRTSQLEPEPAMELPVRRRVLRS